MVRFDIISAVPNLFDGCFNHSILKRAIEREKIAIVIHALKDYGKGPHRQIDDMQYGGGAGMVLMPEPLAACIEDLKSQNEYDEVIYLTPDGETYHQGLANKLSLGSSYILICGHYKGIDERIREEYVTLEISVGDYVLTGGELAAAILVDSVGRLLPGVINDVSSAMTDSFQDQLLAPPVYTRPEVFADRKVPPILLSGHAKNIEEWRDEQALRRTKDRRPDLLD